MDWIGMDWDGMEKERKVSLLVQGQKASVKRSHSWPINKIHENCELPGSALGGANNS